MPYNEILLLTFALVANVLPLNFIAVFYEFCCFCRRHYSACAPYCPVDLLGINLPKENTHTNKYTHTYEAQGTQIPNVGKSFTLMSVQWSGKSICIEIGLFVQLHGTF